MLDTTTLVIILFFIVSSVCGHILLHRVIKTPAQYLRPSREGEVEKPTQ
ncbi:hypothetical protein SVAN01_05711 [Stagonosporopsis vannaccii]|nr:hypothetical protein SVAN01_05711 [Stagonosporopsis vannaccii]